MVVGDEPDNASPQTAPVEAFITQTFPGAHLIEHHRVPTHWMVDGFCFDYSGLGSTGI